MSYTADNEKKQGLMGEYFNNITLSGKPILKRIDQTVNFQWTLYSPDPLINNDFYSVRWTGKIHSPKGGRYKIGLDGNDGYRLYINDKLLIDNWHKQSYRTKLADFLFEKEKDYDIRIEFFEPVGNAHISLVWNIAADNGLDKKIEDAVLASRQTDLTIIVAGIEEGEFRDRAMLTLPGQQERMIKEIAATGKPLVVLLVGGSAVCMQNWLDKANAVAELWYPGEEGGTAVAEVLFGDYNPGGRLPVTFPISEAQLPLVYNHKPTGRGDDYNNLTGLPLFPFGFGLSYTQFEYSGLLLEKNNISSQDTTIAKCIIKNIGSMEGDEVVQLYIKDLLASVARPVMELKGFQRIHLFPGESKEIRFLITPPLLTMYNQKLKAVVEPGDFRIMIGASSRDIRLKETLKVVRE
jgi:beta-glucosidase